MLSGVQDGPLHNILCFKFTRVFANVCDLYESGTCENDQIAKIK